MIFLKYIKSRMAVIFFFILMMAIFCFVTILAGIPWNVTLYAVAIQLFFSFIYICIYYPGFASKLKRLKMIKEKTEYIDEFDFSPYDCVELEYQAIYIKLREGLLQAIRDKENLESALSEYYKLWVHQIKTPLAALDLLVQNSKLSEKNEMKLELAKIEEYLDMLLQFIRLAADNTDFVFSKYNMEEIVRENVKSQSIIFIKKKLSIELENLDVNIITDKKWLGFIIGQILSNALKYTSKGGIVISMVAAKDCHILSIEDSGIGIRAEDLSRIFEDGFTGYNGRTGSKSSGIGLYLCRKIADRLGYSLRASSELGVGTKIDIVIPCNNVRYE